MEYVRSSSIILAWVGVVSSCQHKVKCFTVKDYLICYRQTDEGAEILRIVSGYRDLETISFE
jgi:hypothetical protein